MASRYPYTVAELVLKRLLQAEEADIREQLTESLLDRICSDAEFMNLIGDVVTLVPGRNEHFVDLLLFVAECHTSFSEAQLHGLARKLEKYAGHAMKVLFADKDARSVEAAIIVAGHSSANGQDQLVALLRETYEQGEPKT